MNQKEILRHHRLLTSLGRKYPERYVAMIGEKILAMGKDQFAVLKKARKRMKDENIHQTLGLFYLPGKKKHLYLLKHTRAHSL